MKNAIKGLPKKRNVPIDATGRHFVTRQHGYDGPLPNGLEALNQNEGQAKFRKEHLGRYLTSILRNPYDARMVKYLDVNPPIFTSFHQATPGRRFYFTIRSVPTVRIGALYKIDLPCAIVKFGNWHFRLFRQDRKMRFYSYDTIFDTIVPSLTMRIWFLISCFVLPPSLAYCESLLEQEVGAAGAPALHAESRIGNQITRLPEVQPIEATSSAFFLGYSGKSFTRGIPQVARFKRGALCSAFACDNCGELAACTCSGSLSRSKKSFWEKMSVNGHIRVRQETDFQRVDRPTRNRQRLRSRLGLTYTANEEIQAGIRWTTGDRKIVLEPDDRVGSPLSYQDTGDVFDKFEFNLDRIFIAYTPNWLSDFFVTVGKFKHTAKLNPIFTSPVGDLVWDEAVNPEGVAFAYQWTNLSLLDELYCTAGESVVLELGNQDEASLFWIQLLAKKSHRALTVEAGVTWYDWHNLNPDGDTLISFENNFGNQVIPIGPAPEDVVFASEFSILNPILTATYDDGDARSGLHPIQATWEMFHNAKSFDKDRDSGYSIGLQYGPAINDRKQGNWKVHYAWNHVEQESVFTPITQDDFLRATNFRGHWIGLDLLPWKNVEARFWILSDLPILPIDAASNVDFVNGSREEEWRGRLDLTVYF